MTQVKNAVDAIWKTNSHSADQKLVLSSLISKHSLGKSTSSDWKRLDEFLNGFEERFTEIKDILSDTQLSDIKVKRVLEGLVADGYITSTKRPKKFKRKKVQEDEIVPQDTLYAITDKIFYEYQDGTPKDLQHSA